MTDPELVRRARTGDRAAVAELLGTHATQAYRLALHIVGERADAEDVTQVALVKAFTNLRSFDDRRPFAPWLFRIVAHEALNLKRAERTRQAFWQRHTQLEESEDTVESAVLVREEHREVWRALNQLSIADRLVLTLTYFMGMPELDVAAALGIKRGTVKSRKHNAMVRLRAVVERKFPELRHAVLGRTEDSQ